LQKAPLADARNTVKTRLTTIKTDIEKQVKTAQRSQSKRLIKTSLRTLYSGLFISFTLILIWFKIGTLGDRL